MSLLSITSKIPKNTIGLSSIVPITNRIIFNNNKDTIIYSNLLKKNNIKLYSTNNNNNKNEKEDIKRNVNDFDAINLGEKKLKEKQQEKTTEKKEKKENKNKEDKKSQSSEPETHFLRNIILFTGSIGLATVLYTGRPHEKEDSKEITAWLERSKKNLIEKRNPTKKLLPDLLPEPYGHPYTLVLNFDDTLLSVEWDVEKGWRIAKRPGLDFFIQYLSNFYEIIVVSTSSPNISAPLIDKIDPYGLIMYRLYNDSLTTIKNKKVKDLTQYNRDIKKTILIDINKDGFALQPENGILIPKFTGDKNDEELIKLIPFLETMAITAPDDIRKILKSYSNKYIPQAFSDYQEELREKFNKEHREKMSHLQPTNTAAKGLYSALLGGRADSHEGVIGVVTPEWVNPINESEERRIQIRQSFLSKREEWAKMVEEQKELQMEEINKQIEKIEGRKENLKNFFTFGLYKKLKKDTKDKTTNDKEEEKKSSSTPVIILEEEKDEKKK